MGVDAEKWSVTAGRHGNQRKNLKIIAMTQNKMFWLQVSLFLSGDRLLSVTILVTSKTSKSLKSLKSLKIEMFWLQVSLFLSPGSHIFLPLTHLAPGFSSVSEHVVILV
jgi:hypothetical protein